MKIKWTLYRKIQIIIVIVLVVVFVSSQITVSQIINDKIRGMFQENVINTSRLLQKNIEVLFSDASNSLEFIKHQYEDALRDDEEIRDYLQTMKENKTDIINAFMAYNDKSYVLEPHVELVDFDPTERDWYKGSYFNDFVRWSDTYTDEVTGNLVITGSIYIKLMDIDGVLGLDIDLNSLPETIDYTRISENGFVLLVDRKGNILADSKGDDTTSNISEIDDSEFNLTKLNTGILETDKGVYYFRTLRKTDFRLIAFLPNIDLVSATRDVQLISTLVLILALLFGIAISYYLAKRITKPIEELTGTMLSSLSSDNLSLYDGSTSDEINTLIEGYNTMAENVNSQRKTLKTVSNRLKKSESALQVQYDKVAELAYYDHLTGLPNRLSFEQEVKRMIDDRKQFALYYVDLDNFKYINDTYGHNYGDFVLQIVSTRFKTYHQSKFFGARLSGDEFGIIVTFERVHELDGIALKMLQMIKEPIFYNELEFTVTGSIGISMYPSDGKSFEDLLANSDIAMYEAKNKSKNQYMIFDQELRSDLIDRVNIETNLFSSLDNNEIYMCYQPLVNFGDKSIKGFEALVRWESEALGMIYPDVFIPIAEHNLFINRLGYFVLEESIKFGTKLYQEFGKYYEINVNVSLIQLHIETFLDEVFRIINQYAYPPEFLNLEITESVALESDERIRSKLKSLRDEGIKISLDDFGTGYSSLNHLLNIQLTHLKIDRSIIIEATKEGEVYRLIQGIVEFAHAINLKVVAEGIEDEYMEAVISKMNIDYAQGYLYSRPIKADLAIDYIKKEVNL